MKKLLLMFIICIGLLTGCDVVDNTEDPIVGSWESGMNYLTITYTFDSDHNYSVQQINNGYPTTEAGYYDIVDDSLYLVAEEINGVEIDHYDQVEEAYYYTINDELLTLQGDGSIMVFQRL